MLQDIIYMQIWYTIDISLSLKFSDDYIKYFFKRL